jgi:hypothetical protein
MAHWNTGLGQLVLLTKIENRYRSLLKQVRQTYQCTASHSCQMLTQHPLAHVLSSSFVKQVADVRGNFPAVESTSDDANREQFTSPGVAELSRIGNTVLKILEQSIDLRLVVSNKSVSIAFAMEREASANCF